MATRMRILVRGVVQGVGFRPFVFSRAQSRSLRGRVLNNSAGVLVDVEGDSEAIGELVHDIRTNAPPLSTIDSIEVRNDLPLSNYAGFRIVESESGSDKVASVPADVATCEDCLRELFDLKNRRYRYPFINCTNCGPRFTIVEGIPYDRPKTTMRVFSMCAACRAEYENPLDRRFHAEPVACSDCGPRLFLQDAKGNPEVFAH